MEKVRVLQGCSIEEGGIWYHQGAVLEVANASKHVRTVTDGDGKVSTLPCTEPVKDEKVNTPTGLVPKAPKAKPTAETPVSKPKEI